MTQISFIGLGHMGNPMVRNLLKAGFTVKVFDIVPTAIEALAAQGAIAAKSLSDAAQDADVLITMLQTGQQVSETCLGENGLFNHAKKGVLYIDSSSIIWEVYPCGQLLAINLARINGQAQFAVALIYK